MASVAERMLLVMPGEGLVRSAVAAGFDLWAVVGPLEALPGTVPLERLLVTGPVGVADGTLHGLLTWLLRRYGIGQLMCGPGAGDDVRAVVRRVRREREGLLWQDPAAARLKDPVALRRLLREASWPPVRAEEADGVARARAAAERIGLPLTIKSRDAGGRWGSPAFVRDGTALALWAETAADGAQLVEELLLGPRYRVETLSLGGMHHVVSVAREGTGPPGASDEVSWVRSCVRELLDLAGFSEGALRTDTVLTTDGPRVAYCADGGL
ncbi:hypothetical protein ACFYQA_25980 [Streptomyces sp. NPDC005774]|uniref:hypothetical protein n=1 Tax=Streptomyces sp. NPDC005774 TaxID=3364728 RepID=UPI0036CEA46F